MAKDYWVEETEDITYEANKIWANANVLRGTYMPDKYGDVIIPMTVLRRLECTLEPTKAKVVAEYKKDPERAPRALMRDAGEKMEFYCTSELDLAELLNDTDNLAANFNAYLDGFSANVQGIFDGLNLRDHIKRMDQHNCLLPVVQNFAKMDLYPDHFDSSRMGGIFENLVGRFSCSPSERLTTRRQTSPSGRRSSSLSPTSSSMAMHRAMPTSPSTTAPQARRACLLPQRTTSSATTRRRLSNAMARRSCLRRML